MGRLMDAKIETSQGESEYKDYPLKLNWSKRLRNLKFTSTIKKLMDMKIIAPCTATIGSVRTMDNVTYPYNAGSCWTLTSSHCGPNPVYAVFSKKVGNKLAIRAYFGGHSVEISPSGDVKVNGASMSLPEGEEKTHSENGQEIFKLFLGLHRQRLLLLARLGLYRQHLRPSHACPLYSRSTLRPLRNFQQERL